MRRIQRKEREWAGKDTEREYRWERVAKGTNIKGKWGKRNERRAREKKCKRREVRS